MSDILLIAVDWGTTSFRLWAMGADLSVSAACDGPFGMSCLKRGDFNNFLEENLTNLGVDTDVPVLICGMAGAAQGWCEAPYLETPTRLDAIGANAVKVQGVGRDVRILPGVKQMSPANVMRGEETQIAGLLHHHPKYDGTICLPGTHTKWVRIADQRILDFETCMTGEQFAFFSTKSVLSHSMLVDGWNDDAFIDAVKVAFEDPADVSCRLFRIRAETLLGNQTSAEARARLSGLLIGQELAATKKYWEGKVLSLIGAGPLCQHYRSALNALGCVGQVYENEKMTLAGLLGAFQIHRDVKYV